MNLNYENEDVQLLEDSWFFGNLLQTKSKSRMLRSLSDPCSSSNYPGKSYEETYESITKELSLSSSRRDGGSTIKERRSSKASRNSLGRAPSLPTSLETEGFHDEEEIEFSMGKLIRQASLNYSDNRPPKSSSISRQKSRVNKLMTQKSLKEVDTDELQGFKDLGVDVEENALNSVPELHEEKRSAPPVPRWGGKRSTEEDMKAQIKFWARAVASNVRQEC